jgi:aspartate/methionine/tyrosine aminotransferase
MKEFAVRPSLADLKFSPTLMINEQVARYRAAGKTVYHMGFGESPFPVHPIIQKAIAGYSGKNQYLPAAGLTELREKAKFYIRKKHDILYDEYEAMIGPGSKELIFDIQLAVDGDLLFPAPSWVSYIPQTMITRDNVIRISLGPERSYKLDGDQLERAITTSVAEGGNPTKLILNYPNNPTGMTYTPDELEEIASVARRHSILVISDEIYAQVAFRRPHRSIAYYYPEGTIVTTGLSKHLSLGGFRLGVALVPRRHARVFEVLRSIASETFSAVSTPIQYSVLTAFEENDEIEKYIDQCTEIHDIVTRYVWNTLRVLSVDYAEPQGGFYLYPDFSRYAAGLERAYGVRTSFQLARELLDRSSLASLPSTAFGDDNASLRLRLSTVDFDGLSALIRYRDGAFETEEEFVERVCPRVALGCRALESFFQEAVS